jgi:hypothetical protein
VDRIARHAAANANYTELYFLGTDEVIASTKARPTSTRLFVEFTLDHQRHGGNLLVQNIQDAPS